MAYGALGGGTFTVQNKLLPGTYTKMISQPKVTSVWSERGYAAIALPLDWGKEGNILTLTAERLMSNSADLLGHAYTDEEMKPIRDIFKGAKVLHLYNLNSGGSKAQATVGGLLFTAVHPGNAGNNLSVRIEAVPGAPAAEGKAPEQVVITTYFDGREVDKQTIKAVEEFKANGFITLLGSITTDSLTLHTKLEGGENGAVLAGAHEDFLKKIQGEYYNVIAYAGEDEEVKRLYLSFIQNQVYNVGYMAQLVLHRTTANERFVTNVAYDALDDENKAASVYWYLGQSAGISLGQSVSAVVYNGEYEVSVVTDVLEGEEALKSGKLIMIKSDGDTKILEDVNSFTNYSKELGEDWSLNEVVRIVIQRIQNISELFNKYYMHKELNDDIGRGKLWADIAWSAREQFQNQLRLIEDYEDEDTIVRKGEQKGGVVILDQITPVVTMSKLYLTVAIA